MVITLFFRGFSILTLLLLMSFSLIPITAYSQTFDEWFEEGWNSGCKDSTNSSLNQTEGKNTPFTKGYNTGFEECSPGNAVYDTVNTGIQNDSNSMAQNTDGLPLDGSLQNSNASTAEPSSKEVAYDIGCDDVGLYESEKYINQPGKGPSFDTEEFMNEYYQGYYNCGGDVSPTEKGFGPGTHSQFYQPQPSEPLYTPQPSQEPMQGGIDWIKTCNDLQTALVSSCDVLVNPDNTLTTEGERAVGCIRNGIALAGGGTLLLSLPTPLVVAALQILEEPTGCGGIVEWGSIGNVDDLQGIINRLT